MRSLIFCVISLLTAHTGITQTGSAGSPFTSLGQARNITGTGVYYFNLGGVTFSSTINKGWVLIASDSGLTTTILPTTTALSTAQRGILTPTVLGALTSTSMLKVTTSDGNINDSSSNATLISRMTHDSTLHLGSPDIGINSTWTGSGTYALNLRGANASATNNVAGVHLDSCIFWPDGDGNGTHWIPSIGGFHRENWSAGEVAKTVAFDLWVEAPLIVILPITFADFQGYQLGASAVKLEWTSENEVNADLIVVERSKDGISWSELAEQKAQGTTNVATSSSVVDNTPYIGNNYYRLKEIDLDGSVYYSPVIVVNFSSSSSSISLFPDPTSGEILLAGNKLTSVSIYSMAGQNVTSLIKMGKANPDRWTLDLSALPKGLYVIKANGLSQIVELR